MPAPRGSVRLLRHATLLIEFAGRRLLVDPMLSEVGAMPPIPDSPNDRRNPLVGLPDVELDHDAVLVTHDHRDHFDMEAKATLPGDRPLFCQPPDESVAASAGFEDVRPVEDTLSWGDVEIARTGGEHGTGDLAERMGPVSGFVLDAPEHPTLYLTGDTLWCGAVRDALDAHDPDWIVANAGGARFTGTGPITMEAADVARLADHAADATVVAVHMDSINHCLLTRADLRARLDATGWSDRVRIPDDGETVALE